MGVKRSGNLAGKMKGLTDEMRRQLSTAVYAIADNVKVDAQISITHGSVSGAGHRASAPGAAPNNDTGHLADSIQVEHQPGSLEARVVATAEYAAIQELGGTINHPGGTAYFIGEDGMAVFVPDSSILSTYLPRTKPHKITLPERPYMRPAAKKNMQPGKAKMRIAVDFVLKGGKVRE